MQAKNNRRELIQSIVMRNLFDDGYTIAPIFNTELEKLDLARQKVIEERFLSRREGTKQESLFKTKNR